ncbi:MAG TPA: hypothetical protein EYM69_03225 [Dehalococcoidia bacterium]|nr:hypothetical protein [Dehalococcoidia bacterium]
MIYVGVIISGGILIALGFGIMGASFFDSTDSFEGTTSGFATFVIALAGYLWIFFGGFALFIKLLADVVSESVSENFFRTSELIKTLFRRPAEK